MDAATTSVLGVCLKLSQQHPQDGCAMGLLNQD